MNKLPVLMTLAILSFPLIAAAGNAKTPVSNQLLSPFWENPFNLRAGFKSLNTKRNDHKSPELSWLIGSSTEKSEKNIGIFRLEAGYEIRFNQHLVLSHILEFNHYNKNNIDSSIASNYSNIETGIRLRYEVQREVAPYIGVIWLNRYHESNFTKIYDDTENETLFIIGLRSWF